MISYNNFVLQRRKKYILFILLALILTIVSFFVFGVIRNNSNTESGKIISGSFDKNKMKSDAEWRNLLSAEQYRVLRERKTEKPFSGKLLQNKKPGLYVSAGCDQALFRSEEKYDANTGFLSFAKPVDENALVLREENALFKKRIEALDVCGSHLGYVEEDEKSSTKMRYSINSAALKFIEDTVVQATSSGAPTP